MEKRVIVIPAYREEQAIGDVVRAALGVADRVLVVDDGSGDRTGEIAASAGATVVRHAINRGLGGALSTGIEGALRLGADLIVTMDADGQHRAGDAKRAFDRLAEGDVDFVIGSRMLEQKGNMPLARRYAQRAGNALTFLLYRKWVTDSQSGLRGMTRSAAERITLRSSRMEVSSEFIKEIVEKNLRLVEIPIEAVYTSYSLSKGQSFAVGIETALKLIWRRLLD
ncbi:MAG: glycosyltransferase family 2 protein [Patescibacteria group bacterium]|nr:MAG: glycosyltransferase family 2 protein [Patescibacteria group bacterium]